MLIGLFDVLGAQLLPAVFPRICTVNRWCSGKGTFKQRTRIVSTEGNKVIAEGKDISIELGEMEATATTIEIFVNVKFETTGTYWVEIMMEDSLKLRYPFSIQKMPNHSLQPGGSTHV